MNHSGRGKIHHIDLNLWLINCNLGWVTSNLIAFRGQYKKVFVCLRQDWEQEPIKKVFKAKNKNVPILKTYPRGQDFGEEYWSKWIRNEYSRTKGSLIDHVKFGRVAQELGYGNIKKIEYIKDFLENGAVLGVESNGRWPSVGKNSPSAYEYGERVADSLQQGIRDGYLFGPFTASECYTLWPQGFKVSPIMVRLKPNGSARIIMDLSHPRDVQLHTEEACSPNTGMKNFTPFEPLTMTSDKEFREAMIWAGWPADVMKTDWSIAYKHVSVCSEDHHLQLVEFGGRFFVEKCLTFGGSNSPSYFNLPAKTLIEFTEIKSGMDSRLNVQQLDDNCSAGPAGSPLMKRYQDCYREIAETIGVQLAPEDDPSKAFPPSRRGEILGIIYDGHNWTWEMPRDKGLRLLVSIGNVLRKGVVTNGDAQALAGRLNHYSNMVNGKFNRCLISHMCDEKKEDSSIIKPTTETKVCLVWWLLNLRALQTYGLRIPHPGGFLVNTALVLHTDAAGGDTGKKHQGWGLVNPQAGEWARGTWPTYILNNKIHLGKKWGRKLSFLEGFAALLAVPLWAEGIQAAGGAALLCDNMGFMWAYKNGSSREEHVWTIAKCLCSISQGLGVPIKVFHTRRRTDLGDKLADDLSKNKLESTKQVMPNNSDRSHEVSRVLIEWLANPRVRMELGRDVLIELKTRSKAAVEVGLSYLTAANELGVKW